MKINIEAFVFKANSKRRFLKPDASNESDPPSDPPPMPPLPGSFKKPRIINLTFMYSKKFLALIRRRLRK